MKSVADLQESNHKPWLVFDFLLLSDILGLSLAFYSATLIRPFLTVWLGGSGGWTVDLPLLYLAIGLTVVMFAFSSLYPGYGLTAVEEIKQVVRALTIVFGFLAVTVYFLKTNANFPRSIFIIAWLFSLFWIPAARIILRRWISGTNWYGIPIIFVIRDLKNTTALDTVLRKPRLGWKPAAVTILDPTAGTTKYRGIPCLSGWDELESYLEGSQIRKIVIDTFQNPGRVKKSLSKKIRTLSASFNPVILVYPTYELGSTWVKPIDLEGQLGLELHHHLLNPLILAVKKVIDLVGSLLLLTLTLPIMMVIAVLIKVDSHGPVIYKHSRVGRKYRKFKMFKFRTMVENADQLLEKFLSSSPPARQEWENHQKLTNDPRLTRVGKWLRKFSLDELPQFWNVLRGEMSLIGPRAVTEAELEKYGDYADLILKVKPGITGWWQVMGRNQTTWERRTQLEVYYVSNWSLWMDAYILVRTVWVMISGQGR